MSHPIQASTEALAAEIVHKHRECEGIQQDALSAITSTIEARVSVARLVETAHSLIGSGVAFAKWWREQNLPAGWAAKYLRLAKTADRNMVGDKNQLRLIGLLPEPESGNAGNHRKVDMFAWTKWAGKICHTFTPEFTEKMGSIERASAAKLLEPIVELHRKLSSSNFKG